jgi:hypothetical protein
MNSDPPIDRLWKDAVRNYLGSMRPDELAQVLAEVQAEEPDVQPTEAASPETLKDRAARAVRDYRGYRD